MDKFLSFSLHYTTNEFTNKMYQLDIVHMSDKMTAVNINLFLRGSLEKWGIDETTFDMFFTTDNGSNLIAAIRLSDNWTRIACFCHTLQLVITDTSKVNILYLYRTVIILYICIDNDISFNSNTCISKIFALKDEQ